MTHDPSQARNAGEPARLPPSLITEIRRRREARSVVTAYWSIPHKADHVPSTSMPAYHSIIACFGYESGMRHTRRN
jgi:hypothetical protein